MTAVNCPMCVLRFATRTERDWHLRNEHVHAHVHPPTNQSAPWTHRTPAPEPEPKPDEEAQS
jgi:hypothetical protein